MTKFIFETNEDFNEKEAAHIKEIFLALIRTGGLMGVRDGQTIIHFDFEGNFRGIELDYWPWRKRKENLQSG